MGNRVDGMPRMVLNIASAVSVVAALALTGCDKPREAAPQQQVGVLDLPRPLAPARWVEYYDACLLEPFANNRPSGELRYPRANPYVKLVLMPHDGAHQGDQTELNRGRFVGIILNSGTGSLDELNIEPATATGPSRTCVWIEKKSEPDTYQVWLVTRTKPVARPAERIEHRVSEQQNQPCPHTFPAAAWRDRGLEDMFDCPGGRTYDTKTLPEIFTAPVEPATPEELQAVLKTFWFTCDLVGCCKGS